MRALPKGWTWLAIVLAILAALNTAEVITIVGPKLGAVVTVLSTVLAAVSRALQDSDGDGVPDALGGNRP